MKRRSRILRAAVLLLSAAGFVWFLGPVFWNVLNIGNVLGMAVCFAVFLAAALRTRVQRVCSRSGGARALKNAVLCLFFAGLLWAAVLSGLMASASASRPPEGATVVVLGSKVNGRSPSADLWARIDAAAEYLNENPSAKCVACGGRGPGESVTEAEAIRSGLASKGIDPSRVLPEDRSVNTQENLANALGIIERNGLSSNLAVVTDEYHEYRACSLARRQGAEPYAVPAKTPWYIFSACWARELLALTKFLLLP